MATAVTTPGEQIAEKYRPFHIIDVPYKHVHDTPIPASILVPKTLQPGKYPVLVRWHGGGFGTGHRLFADWYGDWTLDLALKHKAVSITPDYRLIPEATGLDILQDARDFYTWLFSPTSTLAQSLPTGIQLDLTAVLVTGESAGGWHALQSGLLNPPSRISAIISHYPMVDLRHAHFTQNYHKDISTPPMAQQDPSLLADHIKSLSGTEIVTSHQSEEANNRIISIMQQGLYPTYFGTARALYPLEMLEQIEDGDEKVEGFPPVWLLHGTADSVVPVASSEKFAKKLKERWPDAALHLTLQEGEEHGFDLHDAASGQAASLETDWVRSGVDFIEKYWPK